ncbi:DUF3095 domain-containing protein [Lutimaribacter marinistellae]|uniref:DUF3095 domain-containing protein n=1 Tax=Lutimaribacter marinistellae TaxID=1820329 RepID=A0ABV7TCF7_9RHOB
MTSENDQFYHNLPRERDFSALADPAGFRSLPDDWLVGTADIVNSTEEVARGRYKIVNTVGAAVISAMVNALGKRPFPYVFGGDGACFAIPPEDEDTARQALAKLRRWADEEFGIPLRGALVPVAEIRGAGYDVTVARFAASHGVDYAMFAGGGVAWAEERMKAGDHEVPIAPPGAQPDLTGLSCRWSNAVSKNGQIVSLIVHPTSSATPRDFADIAKDLVEATDRLDRSGHPLPVAGPGIRWPPPGLEIEAKTSRKGGNVFKRRIQLLLENLFAWTLFRTGFRLGDFDPVQYAQSVSGNADFRKFDDGLKMTIDCDAETLNNLRQILSEARSRRKIEFGIFVQEEAMVTCFVPSALSDDHVHFVDGAAGGYARAAAGLQG